MAKRNSITEFAYRARDTLHALHRSIVIDLAASDSACSCVINRQIESINELKGIRVRDFRLDRETKKHATG